MLLFARPLREADTPVRPVWLDTVVAKFAAVDTIRLYDAALATVPHVRVGEVRTFTEPLVGVARAGATGAPMMVVKLQTLDQLLVPPAFVDFTSQ